jgi:hypothetical protein
MTLNEFKELLKKVINTPELLAEMGLALEAIDGGAVTVTDLTATGTATLATADVTGSFTANLITTPQVSATTVTATNVVATNSITVNGDITVVDDIVCDGLTIESLAFTGATGTWAGDLNGGSGTLFRAEQIFVTSNLQHEGTFLGFYNTTPTTKPNVTGVTTGTLTQLQASVRSVINAGEALGLWTDSTT